MGTETKVIWDQQDETPIEVIYFAGENGGSIRVGEYGCVSIRAYREPSVGGYAPWFAARYADGRESRWNAALIEGVAFAAPSGAAAKEAGNGD